MAACYIESKTHKESSTAVLLFLGVFWLKMTKVGYYGHGEDVIIAWGPALFSAKVLLTTM